MQITATELKKNIGKYLEMAAKNEQEVLITKNGKVIAKLSKAVDDKIEIAKSLFGIIPDNITLDQIREEKLKRYENPD